MGWWKTAKPGDKVVCVDDSTTWPTKSLTKGNVYTIADIIIGNSKNGNGELFTNVILIRVAEVMFNPHTGNAYRNHPKVFRPVQPKSTDKSFEILKSILNGQPVKEDA